MEQFHGAKSKFLSSTSSLGSIAARLPSTIVAVASSETATFTLDISARFYLISQSHENKNVPCTVRVRPQGDHHMTTKALLVKLEAKPGKENEVAKFLRDGQGLVAQEPATTAWFGIQLGPSTFAIFDAFPDDAGRDAHLSGKVAKALMEKAPELLAEPPKIEKADVLADRLPG